MIVAPYRLSMALGTFGNVPEDAGLEAVDELLETLTRIDELWLRFHPETPALYEAGVRYRFERDDRWVDWPVLLAEKWADCEDLAAARASELRAAGVDATAKARLERASPGDVLYHAIVLTPWGIEDPSAELGMR